MHEWIDVNVKLPSRYGTYLTYNCNHKFVAKLGGVQIMRYYPKLKRFKWFNIHDGYDVTHWMKIPNPPINDCEGE